MRILCLDGGGVRGLVAAVWLDALERAAGRPVGEMFDLVAGSSTGAILAASVAAGRPAAEVVELYLTEAPKIFPGRIARFWDRLGRLFRHGLSAPRYDGDNLDRVLRREIGEGRFGDLPVKTLITSYDASERKPRIFKSWNPDHVELPSWAVCRASCSAPGYFPAMALRLKGRRRPLIDGGIVANNPSACALAEGWRLCRNDNRDPSGILLASFGTGEATRPVTLAQAREWGPLEWALPIIGTLFDGASDAADYVVRQILDEDRYFRFQAELNGPEDDIDGAGRENLEALYRFATTYLQGKGREPMRRLLAGLG